MPMPNGKCHFTFKWKRNANDKWQMANGKWQMANGKWQKSMPNAKCHFVNKRGCTLYSNADATSNATTCKWANKFLNAAPFLSRPRNTVAGKLDDTYTRTHHCTSIWY